MQIGITERGDASLDLSWVNKLKEANVIISKDISAGLHDNLIQHKDKIIFHMTCTGYGGTILEPNVIKKEELFVLYESLIHGGFPANQIVLRIDPIIPTERGIKTAESVLKLFYNKGITRVRFSFIDMYPHVIERFKQANLKLPFNDFLAPEKMRYDCLQMFQNYNLYKFESCAENNLYKLGCISQLDLMILKIKKIITPGGKQRKGCLCAGNKTELLSNKFRCKHKCLYCYWKDGDTSVNQIEPFNPSEHTSIFHLSEENHSFKCVCECNVFHNATEQDKLDDIWTCNACKRKYQGEK